MRPTAFPRTILFLMGMLLAGLYYQVLPQTPLLGVWENVAVAESLATGHGFANPFPKLLDTGPSAHVAPIYPALLAALRAAFSFRDAGIIAFFLTLILHGIHAILLPEVSRVFFRTRRPGLYAAVISSALPVFRVMPSSEAMLSAIGAMLFCLLSFRMLREPSPGGTALTGLAAGAVLMLNPALICVALPLIAFLTFRMRLTLQSRSRIFLGVFVCAFLVCVPWTVRNYQTLGRLVFIRDNLGLELYVSQNDCAQPTLQANKDAFCTDQYHPEFSITESRAVLANGEGRYNSARLHSALGWIAGHPYKSLDLTTKRIFDFWFPERRFGLYSYSIWSITILSLFGLASILRRHRWTGWLMLGVLLLYPLLYYMIQSSPRYRYPILWISLLAMGYSITALSHRYRRSAVLAAVARRGEPETIGSALSRDGSLPSPAERIRSTRPSNPVG